MARIAGVDLPRDKRVEIGLTYIFGLGRKSANDILTATGVNPDTRVRDLTEDEIAKLREYIDHHYTVEGDLRRNVDQYGCCQERFGARYRPPSERAQKYRTWVGSYPVHL